MYKQNIKFLAISIVYLLIMGLTIVGGLPTVAEAADPPGTFIVDTPIEAAQIGADGFTDYTVDLIIQTSITPITKTSLAIRAKSISIESGVEIINSNAYSEIHLYTKDGSVTITGADIRAKKQVRIENDGSGMITIDGSELVSSSTLLPDDPAASPFWGTIYIVADMGNVEIENSALWGHSKLIVISNKGSVIWHSGSTSGGGGGGGGNSSCELEGFYILLDASAENPIYEYDALGNLVVSPIILDLDIGGTFVPTDIICIPDGFLVLEAFPPRVIKYDLDGNVVATSKTLLRNFDNSQIGNATGLALDGDDLWVVSAPSPRRLFRYSFSAAFSGTGTINALQEITGPTGAIGDPESLAMDTTYFYVLFDGFVDRIYRYKRDGSGSWEASKVLKQPNGNALDQPTGVALGCCGVCIWVIDILDPVGPHTQKEILKYDLASLWPADSASLNAEEMISIVTDIQHDWPMGLCVKCEEESPPPPLPSGGGYSETQISARIDVDIEGLVLVGNSHLNLFAKTGDLLAHGANLTFDQFNIGIGGDADISGATLIATTDNLRLQAGGNVNAVVAVINTVGTKQPILNNNPYPNWIEPPVVTNAGTVVGLGDIRIITGGYVHIGVIDVSDATLD